MNTVTYTLSHVGMSWVVWKGSFALRAFRLRADAQAFLERQQAAEADARLGLL